MDGKSEPTPPVTTNAIKTTNQHTSTTEPSQNSSKSTETTNPTPTTAPSFEDTNEISYISKQLFFELENDEREHINVLVREREVVGIVDSGSQITVIGENLLGDVKQWGDVMNPSTRTVATADDRSRFRIVGTIDVDFTFHNKTRTVTLTVLPFTTRKLILGRDFMKRFGISLKLEEGEPINSNETTKQLTAKKSTSTNEMDSICCISANQFMDWMEYKEAEPEIKPTREVNAIETSEPPLETEEDLIVNPPDLEADVTPAKAACVTLPHSLTREQQDMLESVLRLFSYTAKAGELNATNDIEHVIDTGDAKPIMRKQYPVSPYVMEKVQTELNNMLERGIITKIEYSPWRAPILVVSKKDGGSRICLDARELNKVTIPNAYPITDVNQILARIKTAKYLTSIDLSQAFFQIKLEKKSRFKTAFAFGNQLYCFKRMTMGLRNSPATLAVLIDKIFRDLSPYAFAYVDDFIICTETFEQHMKILAIVARRLTQAGLTISATKSHFCCKRLQFLGYILSEEGLSANPDRIKAIIEYPRPTTAKEARRLAGAAGWYRKFIQNFAEIIAPIHDLYKGNKKGKIEWTPEAEQSFILLKEKLSSTPILTMCDYSRPFKIYCDASLTAGAGVLTQDFDGDEKVICYYSKKFTPAERNYSASERECLAVLLSIEKFRPYVEGVKFTVVTDHSALRWLMSMKDPKGRLARWAIRMQAFEMEIVHKPGKHMELPDALSRAIELIDIKPNETTDDWYKSMMEKATKQELDKYKVENGLLYHRLKFTSYSGERLWLLCVPKELRPQVLLEHHDDYSHQGIWKVYRRLKTVYYWPNMYESVYQYIRKCETCRLVKPSNENKQTPHGKYRDPKYVGRQLSIDLVGRLPLSTRGNQYLFVVIDCYSRFCYVKTLRRATASAIVDFLEKEVFPQNGCPEIIIADNAQQFKSHLYVELCEKYNIKNWYTPRYHPKANQVESTNKNVKMALKTYLANTTKHNLWENFVRKTVLDLNTTPHTSTGQTPYYLTYGRELVRDAREHELLLDVNPHRTFEEDRMKEVYEEAHEKQRDSYEHTKLRQSTRAKKRTFKEGAAVLIPNYKLSSAAQKYTTGVATGNTQAYVKAKIGSDSYELVSPHQKPLGVHHADDIHLDPSRT